MDRNRGNAGVAARLGALLILGVTLGLASLTSQPAHAAPAVTGSVKMVTKAILGETSSAGPALAGWTTGPTRLALAWTGTDYAQHLNVMISDTGFGFASKRILDETSPYGPAVVITPTGKVAIAWAGADAAHTLNVLYDVYGAPLKLTLWGETSVMAPALTYDNGQLYLGWTGRNSGRSLNVQSITIGATSLGVGTKTTLWQFGSGVSPSLSPGLNHVGLILSWSDPVTRAVRFLTSTDGRTWPAVAANLPVNTASGPQLASFAASDMPQTYLVWAGMDALHSVGVLFTSSFPTWQGLTTLSVLDDQAFGSPQLAYIGGPQALLLAWTGINAAHNLNVAVITPSSTCIAPTGVNPVSSQLIVYGNASRKQVALTFDAGGEDGARAGKLLDILASYNVKSTWFIEGEWGQEHRAIIQRVVANGHEVGNHTIDHPDLTKPVRSDEYICYELGMTEQLVQEIGGKTTRPFFRPPFGAYNTQVLNDAARLGYRSVYWSIDPVDWDPNTTADQIVSRVLNSANLKNGSIILMHAGSLHEPEALARVIAGLQAKGYQIVPLSQLVA